MLALKQSLQTDLSDVNNLRAALQTAIELEHSTLPPYLYALYSLKPGYNEEIRQLIYSIVMEEMLHLHLACNILNAIGGAPKIDNPSFIPTYPGPLPGTVEQGLTVPLAPFSIVLVENVFMVIEEPETPLNFKTVQLLGMSDADELLTIGMFYGRIADAIQQSKVNLFTGDPALQVPARVPGMPDFPPIVTDTHSALLAISTIVEQGEGTSESPLDPDQEPAHYYRFAEIVKGRRLIPNPALPADAPIDTPYDERYVYGGAPISFDPAGVWPAMTNPSVDSFPVGSAVRYACQTFNYTYTSLLKALHITFNGQPNYVGTAIGLMESLKAQAMGLMAMPVGPGQGNGGPSFEYQPFLPLESPTVNDAKPKPTTPA